MGENVGNSNRITRNYLDSLLIETRFTDSVNPDPTFSLFGQTFDSPIMTAALSHLNGMMFDGASQALAQGAADANALFWLGMADEEEVESCAAITKGRMVEIIKPYTDRDIIYKKIEHAEKTGILAVGIDIDHPYAEDGSPDNVDGYELKALTAVELAEIVKASKLPLIVKGVLSQYDADAALRAGAGGMLLSHHNNRIEFAIPPLYILPEICKMAAGIMPVFADDEIQTGMDAFKALALGATGVGIGRPLMTQIRKGGAQAVTEYLQNARNQLKKAMAFTGTRDLSHMDATVIHRS